MRAKIDNEIFSEDYIQIKYRGLRIVVDCEGEQDGRFDGVFIYDKDDNEVSTVYFDLIAPEQEEEQ